MQLNQHFERSGRWLFRWRSYLPLLFLFPLAVAVAHSSHDGSHFWAESVWPLVCLFVSLLGLAIRLHCIGHASPRTSGRNTKRQIADSLNTTGMYSIVRHPLYLANFLIALGIVAQPNNWWLICLYAAAFALYYERIMFTEEAFLFRKFGDHYRSWAESTPAFIPRFSGYRRPSNRLNLRRVLKSEGAAVAVITFSFTVMEAAEHAKTGFASLEPWWFVLAYLGTLLYVAGRIYTRWTRVKSKKLERSVRTEESIPLQAGLTELHPSRRMLAGSGRGVV